jgi:hypothetical protein
MDRNDTDAYTYIDYQACIRLANQQRSDALGKMIEAGWHQLTAMVTRITHRLGQVLKARHTGLPA